MNVVMMNCMIVNTINSINRYNGTSSYPNTMKNNVVRKVRNGMTLEEVNHSRRLRGLKEFTEDEWNN